jgi:hypothetical protein
MSADGDETLPGHRVAHPLAAWRATANQRARSRVGRRFDMRRGLWAALCQKQTHAPQQKALYSIISSAKGKQSLGCRKDQAPSPGLTLITNSHFVGRSNCRRYHRSRSRSELILLAHPNLSTRQVRMARTAASESSSVQLSLRRKMGRRRMSALGQKRTSAGKGDRSLLIVGSTGR